MSASYSSNKLTESNFVSLVIDHSQEMTLDTYKRKFQAIDPNSKTKAVDLLKQGIWYPCDYCFALKKFNQPVRLKWVVDSGASFHGAMPKDFFEFVKDPSLPKQHSLCQFVVKKGVLPSQALEGIKTSFCILGCGEVLASFKNRPNRVTDRILARIYYLDLFYGRSRTP